MNDEKFTHIQTDTTPDVTIAKAATPHSPKLDKPDDDFIVGEENEPYLGMSWPVLMLILYVLKTLFPAETFSFLWWFQWYIVLIVCGVTIFTLLKRYRYSKNQNLEKEFPVKELPEHE